MNLRHWLRLYASSFACAFVVIALAQAAKGHSLRYALVQGLIWATITAAVFVAAAIHRWRRARYCALCGDAPIPFEGADKSATGLAER